MEQEIQNVVTALSESLTFGNKTDNQAELAKVITFDGKLATVAPLLKEFKKAADIQTLDTSGDSTKVENYKMKVANTAVKLSKKVQVKAKESGDDTLKKAVNKSFTYYFSANKNLVEIRAMQLVSVLRANVDGLFKDLIQPAEIDGLAADTKLFDDNKNLVSTNAKYKKVNGTEKLEKLRTEGVELLKDMRTLGQGFLPADSAVLAGLLAATDIPEFGKRHTNVKVLVVKEDGSLIGKSVVATDLYSTAKKKKNTYKSNADSIVSIEEHMPGKFIFSFSSNGFETKEVEIAFEKGKTVSVTVVLKGV